MSTAVSQGREVGRAVLSARDLTKVYRMGEVDVHALRGVDFALDEGELVVLLGASGSGKSTLLNILGGLDVPTSGHVFYRGEELTHADERALTRYRREHVGFVFQFYNLIPSLTARENAALVTDKRGLLALLALTLVGSLVWAFLPRPVEVELAPVERGRFEVTVTEPGMTRVKDRYVLSAPLGGWPMKSGRTMPLSRGQGLLATLLLFPHLPGAPSFGGTGHARRW